MVATFNGWEDMPEQEREVLERWEEGAIGYSLLAMGHSGDQRGTDQESLLSKQPIANSQ